MEPSIWSAVMHKLWNTNPGIDIQKARMLLSKGANVNMSDINGWTLLMWSCDFGDLEMVNLLLEHGADIEKVGKPIDKEKYTGYYALMLASSKGYLEVVKTLIHHGAKVNQCDWFAWSPLMCASYNGHLEIVQELTKHMSESDIINKTHNDLSALFYAEAMGHSEVFEFLKNVLKEKREKRIYILRNTLTKILDECLYISNKPGHGPADTIAKFLDIQLSHRRSVVYTTGD